MQVRRQGILQIDSSPRPLPCFIPKKNCAESVPTRNQIHSQRLVSYLNHWRKIWPNSSMHSGEPFIINKLQALGVTLITRRSQVQILAPLPYQTKGVTGNRDPFFGLHVGKEFPILSATWL